MPGTYEKPILELRRLPVSERRSVHDILTGLLLSVVGATEFADMAVLAGHIVTGRSAHRTLQDRVDGVSYRLTSFLIDYDLVHGLIQRTVLVVLDRSDGQPCTAVKHVSAVRYSGDRPEIVTYSMES